MVTLFQTENWTNYLLALIPIFIAIDVVGILPIFISLTEEIGTDERRKIVKQSIMTSFAVSMGFLAIGKFIFNVIRYFNI